MKVIKQIIFISFLSAGMLRYLYCPVKCKLWFFLHFFLQVAVGLRLFGSDSRGVKTAEIPGRVALIQDGAVLRIHSYQHHT